MHLATQEVQVQNLEIGMYVSRLDVPWVQTPFPIQGFHISKQEELELLAVYCNKVYVDEYLSKVNVSTPVYKNRPGAGNKKQLDPKTIRLMSEKARFKPRVEQYPVSTKLKKEIKEASVVYSQVIGQMSITYRDMEQMGYINMSEVKKSSSDMVKSIIKNPDALAWLCRIGSDNEALYQQAIRSAVWGLIFGRHLGLSQQDLKDLGTSLLLAPIGKTKLSKELVYSQQNLEEVKQYQQHVDLTLEETHKMFSSSHQVNYILSSYCERNNGSGYPRAIIGNRIPFLARIAGISDYYEQLINPYPGADSLTPIEAISHLYKVRGELFQSELVEEFIQAIGIYPTGSLVKLNNNAIGIVVEQPEKSRLRPRIALIKDAMNVTLDAPKILNLAKDATDDFGMPLQIERSLKTTATDIDANELHNKLFRNNNWLSFLSPNF